MINRVLLGEPVGLPVVASGAMIVAGVVFTQKRAAADELEIGAI